MKRRSGSIASNCRSLSRILALAASIGSCLFLSAAAAAAQKSQFTLPTLDGEQFSLQEALKQGPVVLDFWATWCKPCIKALPKLQEIAEEYRQRGVGVYTVNTDGPRNQPKVRPFLKRHRLELPVLLDHTREVMKQFQLSVLPATLIISTEGAVVYRHVGYKPGDETGLRDKLAELLAAQPDSTEGRSE